MVAAREFARRAQGRFDVALGEARRDGADWLVPVTVTGDAPVWSVELRLEGGDAATLAGATASDGDRVLRATQPGDNVAAAAFAALDPLTQGEVAVLHFPAGTGEFHAPRLAFARVNENDGAAGPPPQAPSLSFLGRPSPNPARDAGDAAARHRAGRRRRARPGARVDVAGRTVRTLLDGSARRRRARPRVGPHCRRGSGRARRAVLRPRATAGRGVYTQRLIVVR